MSGRAPSIEGAWKKTERTRHRMGKGGVLILQVQETRRVEAYTPAHTAHEEERWRDADVFDLQQERTDG